jgi:UDP-glucose 4-epimerase
MNQLMQDKPLTVFGNGTRIRAFSYKFDVAPNIAHSVNIPAGYNHVFNIIADKEYTVNELAETLIEVIGKCSQIRNLKTSN